MVPVRGACAAAGFVDPFKRPCYSPQGSLGPDTPFRRHAIPANIIVAAKQVIDPETPATALRISADAKRMEPPPNVPPVVNGFDENAVEAALRIKAAVGGRVTVVSVGTAFVMDVVKKPLSMGCDELVLLQDDAFGALDAYGTVEVLLAGIRKVGAFDLVLCGRQASDYDQATVPLGLAERLGIPCLTIAQRVEVGDSTIVVDRAVPEGRETFEAPLPALVTVSNELGQPRYPTLRGIMAASRKQPTVWTAADVGLDPGALAPRVEILELFQPTQEKECSFIEGDTDEEKGRLLALRLREDKLI